MRRKAFIGFLLVFAFLSGQAWAQPAIDTVWEKCLGGSKDDVAQSIVQTTDGGFAVAGYTDSQDGQVTGNHGGEDGWVVKLNSEGAIQWAKCYGDTESDFLYSIIQTNDGGYAVAGLTYSSHGEVSGYHGGGDAWVVKLDDTGGIQWQKCLGGSGEDYANAIIQTADGGFAIAGYTYSNDGEVNGNHGNDDAWVVKLSDTGAILWAKCFGGPELDGASSIIQTSDGGFAVTGWTEGDGGDVVGYHGSGGSEVWVLLLDDTGAILWQDCLGGTVLDAGNSIIQTSDGGFAVAGYTQSDDGDVSGNHGGNDFWVVKLDLSGGIEWQKCLGGSADDKPYSITQTPDGGFVVAGVTFSNNYEVSGNFSTQNGNEWVVKLNDTGAIEWQKCLGGTGSGEQANSIIQIPGVSYVVAGYTGSNDSDVSGNHGGLDAWVVKLSDPDPPVISYITPDAGAPGMCVAVEIIGPTDNEGNFGNDTIYNTNALVQLSRASDSTLVRLGPSIVSWNGRAIQQMFMIEPHPAQIDTEIYFTVTWNGGTSAKDSFQIVTPSHVGSLTGGGTLPTSGRTVRNTMVIDSLVLTNGTWTCPQTDPDPKTPGNQAYLPLRILSKGHIELSNATIIADGSSGTTGTSGGNGGPGGGGGGSGYPGTGGAGYTGGGGDNDGSSGPGGVGSGSTNGSNNWQGGMSIDSATGGLGEQHSGSGFDDGGGGGTGHPFGTSGQNGGPSSSPAGGYGAGSAGGSSGPPFYTTNYGGGGGGNETAGVKGDGTGNNGGNVVGNPMLVPLFGGSGGGAGNQTYVSFFGASQGGCGGGGGGAIELTSFAKLEVLSSTISAQGGNGSNALPKTETAAGGGGGSGGAITIDARDSISIDRTSTFNVGGGNGGTSTDASSNGGNGGIGRIRINGFASRYASDSSKKYFLPQNGFAGPSIERISFTADSFYVHAHAEYWDMVPPTPLQIKIYWMWPSTGIWQSASATFIPDNASHTAGWIYGTTLSPNPADTQLYAVAVQLASPFSDPHVDVPGFLMSHTSGIIAKVTGPPDDSIYPTTINFGDELVGRCSDDTTIEIYSIGKSALIVDSASLSGVDAQQFKVVTALPVSLPPGDSLALVLQFCPDSVMCPIAATLQVYMNDTTKDIALTGCGVQPEMVIHPLILNFGLVHVGTCKDTFVEVSNPGKDPLTITAESISDPRFKVLAQPPIVIGAGDSTKIYLRFCPTDTTITIASDSVIGDAPQSPVALILQGQGKIGVLSMPTVIDFGDVREGTCKDSVFYAKNTGNDILIIGTDPITASGFTVLSPTVPLDLKPDSSIAFTIQFCSTDTGSFQATMSVGTDVPGPDTVLLLVHTGFGILQMPNIIDFGSVAIGGCADTSIPIKNVGTDTLVLTPGTNFQPPFSYQSPATPLVLAPGEVITITLRFCPADTSEASETTHFDTVGIGTNQIFTLLGKGIEGSLSTAGFIDLGCIVQGTSSTITDTIRNTGAATLNGLGGVVTPGGSASIVHNPSASLAPGAIDSVVLVIPATILGPFSATLTLTWKNGVPVTVPITGQVSVPPAITSLDTALVFDSTNVDDSSVMECVQITNYSCISEPLDSIVVSGGLAGEYEIVSNNASHSIADSAIATICIRYKPQRGGGSSATLVAASNGNMVPLSDLSGFGRGNAVGVELAIDTVAGRPGDIVNVPVRTMNDVTAASIDTVTFRVSFDPMQLDLKAPIAPTVPSIQSSAAPTYTMTSYSIGDKQITAAFSTPLTGKPIIAELPFEILQPTANTAAIHLTSASFGTSLATLATTSDGLVQIEQCDTNDLVSLVPSPIDVAQNNPNPLSTRAAVTVTVNTAGHLHLEVYNALGVKVLVPFDGDVPVSTQTIELDASTLPSGAYHYITTWTWVGSNAPSYQPTFMRDEKTMILLGK